jgi:hypothetical protein
MLPIGPSSPTAGWSHWSGWTVNLRNRHCYIIDGHHHIDADSISASRSLDHARFLAGERAQGVALGADVSLRIDLDSDQESLYDGTDERCPVLFDLLSAGAVARVVRLVTTSVDAFRGRIRGSHVRPVRRRVRDRGEFASPSVTW